MQDISVDYDFTLQFIGLNVPTEERTVLDIDTYVENLTDSSARLMYYVKFLDLPENLSTQCCLSQEFIDSKNSNF